MGSTLRVTQAMCRLLTEALLCKVTWLTKGCVLITVLMVVVEEVWMLVVKKAWMMVVEA